MNRIKHYRELRGHTFRSLSKETGLTPAAIHNYEHGKVDPKISSAAKICIALKCKLDDLYPIT